MILIFIKKMRNAITKSGLIIGAIVWLICIILAINKMACLKHGSICGGFDMLLFGFIAIGMLAPAYVAALIFSSSSGSRK